MSKMHEQTAAAVFAALGDGTRLDILQALGGGRVLSATRLSRNADVTRQAIVKHLRVLQEAGLVTHQRHGREVQFALNRRRLDDAQEFLAGISSGWDRAIARLRRMVEEPAAATRRRGVETPRQASGARRRR